MFSYTIDLWNDMNQPRFVDLQHRNLRGFPCLFQTGHSAQIWVRSCGKRKERRQRTRLSLRRFWEGGGAEDQQNAPHVDNELIRARAVDRGTRRGALANHVGCGAGLPSLGDGTRTFFIATKGF